MIKGFVSSFTKNKTSRSKTGFRPLITLVSSLVVLLESNERALVVRSNVLSLNDFDLKFTRLTLVRCFLRLFRNVKLALNTLQGSVDIEDACLEFNFPNEQLVFSVYIVVNKFFELDFTGHVGVTLAEQFFYDLNAVVFIDAFLC